jgi:hypothetical protein
MNGPENRTTRVRSSQIGRLETTMNTKKRNPLSALKTPDQRLRRDAKAALRYILEPLEGEQLRVLLTRLHVLLAEYDPALTAATKDGRP